MILFLVMNVLHYSFSLSACPKCHLLICKHTSLANLDFNSNEQQNLSEEYVSNGTNLYLFPSTLVDNRYSWTTFGRNSNENLSLNNKILCENILNSTSIKIPTDYHRTKSNSSFSSKEHSCAFISLLSILLLIFSFLITNTIDIVLIYIYYHTTYIYLLSFLLTIFICDVILWIIETNHLSLYYLLIPFNVRFYLLYQLLEFLVILFDKNLVFNSLYKRKKEKLYKNLTLFYLIHTGFLTLINLYIWLNNSAKFFSNSSSISIYFEKIFSNYLQISDRIPSSSLFILISILYYLIINYSLLSTLIIFKQFSFLIILARLCLIIPRIYVFILIFYFNISWLIIILFIIHFILIIILIFNRLKFKSKQKKIFLQLIFSLITHQSINNISINLLIFLENISIQVYQFYYHQTKFDFRVFLSILLSLQMLGFIFHILSKYIHYPKNKKQTNVSYE